MQDFQRPDIDAVSLNILVNELPAEDNDFVFLTPHASLQTGPAIYDLRGVSTVNQSKRGISILRNCGT